VAWVGVAVGVVLLISAASAPSIGVSGGDFSLQNWLAIGAVGVPVLFYAGLLIGMAIRTVAGGRGYRTTTG
jgi:hypothetical protein